MILRAVPHWSSLEVSIWELTGGITNRNYLVTVDGQHRVVRIPGERTELLGINRAHEAEATRRAADLGISPAVIGELREAGTLITDFVDGAHLEGEAFVGRLGEVVELVHRFHSSGSLGGAFPIHRVVEWHARDALAHGVALPSQFSELHDVSRQIETAFEKTPEAPVPCHNDLLPANVLFGPHRVWLLDFEYAGMNDRYFDLGNLSVNCALDQSGDEAILRAYFGSVSKQSIARLQLMKIMSEFREGMWAVVQQAISTIDTDFVAYANERLENCARLAFSPNFERLITDAGSR